MIEPDVDPTYRQASMRALGRAIAQMWGGLREGGMDRSDALTVILEYVKALAQSAKPDQ